MKRTFDVCMSIGVNGYLRVEAESKREAKRLARNTKVGEVNLHHPVTLDDANFTFDGVYELVIGDAIDHAEIDKEVATAAKKRGRK